MNAPNSPSMSPMTVFPDSSMQLLSTRHIFFGHQSVGQDILDGLVEILREQDKGNKIKVSSTAGLTSFSAPGIYHCFIGKNTEPLSKIDDFEEAILNEKYGKMDIAIMKLCFIDITRSTMKDIDTVFQSYKTAIDRIKSRYPDLILIHCTVPLQTRDAFNDGILAGLYARIMKLFGIRRFDGDNWVRELYNRKIRAAYGSSGALFDIALLEASSPTGEKCAHTGKSIEVYDLYPPYSNDGGHLNAAGKRYIADKFLEMLLQAAKKTPGGVF